MTVAPPETFDCNKLLTGAPGIGSTDLLDDIMGLLTERERIVLSLRMGVDGERWTLQRIGEKYHVGRERIRSIEAKALQRLRHPAHKELIEELRSHVTETPSSNAEVSDRAGDGARS